MGTPATLDILINNVGMNIRRKAEEYRHEDFEKVLDTNFFSAWRVTKAFFPKLKKAGEAGGATVVNVSSVAALNHVPSGVAYGASKAAMDQMTRNLSVEWSRFGIRVNAVGPGPVETPLMASASPVYKDEFKKRI